ICAATRRRPPSACACWPISVSTTPSSSRAVTRTLTSPRCARSPHSPNLDDVTIDELIKRYDALLLDGFGVLVHGSGALPGARELIDDLNRRGKPYYILTNDASRLPESRAARFRGFGLAVEADRFITSGGLLKSYFAERGLAGTRC